MNLKYKIVRLDLTQHSMIVRYYTDRVTESMLCIARDAQSGDILQCATDYNYSLPIPVPEGQALIDFIEQRAPVDWLAAKESVLDPYVDTSMTALHALVGQENLKEGVVARDSRSPLEKAKEEKLQEVAAWRYAQETSGVNVGGAMVRTDRESQATVANTLLSFQAQFIAEVDWKAANGWIKVNQQQLTDIGAAVATHVQGCFSQERMFSEMVDAATTTEEVAAITLPTVTIPAQVV